MNHNTDSNTAPETIRSEIDQTRERMDHTIDALAERVKGRHLFDEILGFFRSSNGSDRAREIKDNVVHSTHSALQSVAHSIKANPAPVLLIGAGLTWMIYKSVNPTSESRDYGQDRSHGMRGNGFSAQDYPDWTPHSKDEGDPARLAGEYYGANEDDEAEANEMSGESPQQGAADTIKAKVGKAVSRVSDQAEHLREKSHEWSARVKDRSRELYEQSQRQVTQTVHEHPLSVGLGCLATGIVAGLLIPTPRRAKEAIRPQAQRLREHVLDVGHDLAERGRHVADATVEAFKEEAKHQGLTPEALKDKARAGGTSTPAGTGNSGASPTGDRQ